MSKACDEVLVPHEHIPNFRGIPRKIRLESNNISYGPCPEPEEEVEQHLTLNDQGRVWFAAFQHGDRSERYVHSRSVSKTVGKDTAKLILTDFARCFSDYQPVVVTDAGDWKLTITNTDNEEFKYYGSLFGGIRIGGMNLSELLREELQMDDLFAFDGNYEEERIERIAIEYRRHHVVTDKAGGTVTRDCFEKLYICRDNETIEYIIDLSLRCSIKRLYHIEDEVSYLLDQFDADTLFEDIPDTPDDAVVAPNIQRDYSLTVDFRRKPQLHKEGIYDKYGLPADWAEFIDSVWELICRHDAAGEIGRPEVYAKSRRRKSDLIFLYVEFADAYKAYCYLAAEDIYSVGDMVDVPVGKDSKKSVARVVRVDYLPAEKAPFPLNKTKYVIGIHRL